jgi:hypothetical protein
VAGCGPAPKDPKRRARTNSDPVATTTLRFERAEQPDLPEDEDVDWHPRTRDWWVMWRDSPQAEHFMASDWSFLLDTALMHHAMWSRGQWTLAAEVRLRVAKYGATPEDRARLRMQFADADEKDSRRPVGPSARERRGVLHALPTPKASGE